MKVVMLLMCVIALLASGMALMQAKERKDKNAKIAWSAAVSGWAAALLGILF